MCNSLQPSATICNRRGLEGATDARSWRKLYKRCTAFHSTALLHQDLPGSPALFVMQQNDSPPHHEWRTDCHRKRTSFVRPLADQKLDNFKGWRVCLFHISSVD